jgi:hypothetical protein
MKFPEPLKVNKYYNWYCSLMKKTKTRNNEYVYYENHHIIPKCFGGSNSSDNITKLTAREHYIAHLLLSKISFSKKKHEQMLHALMAMTHKSTRIPSNRDYTPNSKLYESSKKEWIDVLKSESIFSGGNNPGKNMSEETIKKIRESSLKLHQDPEYKKKYDAGRKIMVENMDRDLISRKTKEGMWKTEVRQRYLDGMKTRDMSFTKDPEVAKKMLATKLKKYGNLNLSEETKRKISDSNKGKKMSNESRKKLSDTQKKQYANGEREPWNKGLIGHRTHSEETKLKMRESHKKRKAKKNA